MIARLLTKPEDTLGHLGSTPAGDTLAGRSQPSEAMPNGLSTRRKTGS